MSTTQEFESKESGKLNADSFQILGDKLTLM